MGTAWVPNCQKANRSSIALQKPISIPIIVPRPAPTRPSGPQTIPLADYDTRADNDDKKLDSTFLQTVEFIAPWERQRQGSPRVSIVKQGVRQSRDELCAG